MWSDHRLYSQIIAVSYISKSIYQCFTVTHTAAESRTASLLWRYSLRGTRGLKRSLKTFPLTEVFCKSVNKKVRLFFARIICNKMCSLQIGCVVILSFITSSYGSRLQSQCPWTCFCSTGDNITTVKCKDKYWTTVPPLPINTSVLTILKANIKHLPSQVFYKAHGQRLTKVTLSGTPVVTVDKEAFWGLTSLYSLTITDSKIDDLPDESFTDLSRLTKLRLAGHKLKKIPTSSICQLKTIKELILMDGDITSARFPNCFENLTNLLILSLSGNPLSKISKEDFHALRAANVQRLQLSNCKLETLDPEVFAFLPNLTTLDLGTNHLNQLDPQIFSLQFNLKQLYIHGNDFTTIPSSSLVNTPRLQDFNLGENKFKTLEFGSEFLNLRYLRMLDVGGNKLGIIHNDTFVNLTNSRITQLILSNCKLNSIEAEAFAPLKHLEQLTLSFNTLSAEAFEKAFYGLRNKTSLYKLTIMSTNLRNLTSTTFQYLSRTSITDLEAQRMIVSNLQGHVFSHLPQLQKLNLKGSSIEKVSDDAFASLSNLSYLELNNNKLTDLPKAYKVGLKKLETLDISGNPIKALTSTNCMGYFGLRTFYASNCAIQHITKNAFQDMKMLEKLVLYWNKISFIQPDAFFAASNLKIIRLNRNILTLSERQTPAFGNLGMLEWLDLSNNANLAWNVTLLKMLLSNLTNLRKIELDGTGLHELPSGLFGNLTKITTLELSNNHISSWHADLFKNLDKLELLTIRNNSITLINRTSLIYLKSLKHLDASGNPFSCTCDLIWFRDWIFSSNVYVDQLGPSYHCASPTEMRNKPLADFTLTARQCMNLGALYAAVAVLFSYVALVTGITVMYRFRWYIRYQCFPIL